MKQTIKASKAQVLRLIVERRHVSIWQVAVAFGLSYNGAKLKLWRLEGQGLVDSRVATNSRRKEYWITRAGRRRLEYLETLGEEGGVMGPRNLKAENKSLQEELAAATDLIMDLQKDVETERKQKEEWQRKYQALLTRMMPRPRPRR